MERGWEFPRLGYIKINVHAAYYDHPLPNGNICGIGVVLRNDEGDILCMVSGTKRHLTRRGSELWSMLIGLRCAFYRNKHKVVLETESEEALTEWNDWRWHVDENHRMIIQQLENRKKDKRLELETRVVQQSQNGLARYLAIDGAQNRTRLVLFTRPFGRVRELWHLDMGLGSIEGDFDLVEEERYNAMQQDEVEQEGFGEVDVQALEGVQDEEDNQH